MRITPPSLAVAALAATLAVAPLRAQATATPPPPSASAAPSPAPAPSAPPKCDAPEFRQFDFWVGDWDVTIQGTHVGTSRVTREEDGCLVHELWHADRGETGQSLNFYDRNDGRWHQVWVSNHGGVLDLGGSRIAERIAYTGETRRPDGVRVLHRLSFVDNPDGTVRQLWDVSTDGGATWKTSWDALYRRRAKP